MRVSPTRHRVRRITSVGLVASAALALVASAVTTAAAHTAPDEERARPSIKIIGGVEQPASAHPWMAALLNKGSGSPTDRQFCGGSLISADVVLTAAHCVTGTEAKQLEVTVGRTVLSDKRQGQLRNVRSIVSHPRYAKGDEAYDLALLELAKPVAGIAAVKMPTAGTDALLRPGAQATVIGWGNTDTEVPSFPDRLRGVKVPLLSHAECTATYPAYNKAVNVCAGVEGKDSCQGDSGGPLFRKVAGRTYQIGIVSYGEGCGEQGAPGVYTSTSSKKLWDTLAESREGKRMKQLLRR
ncbi:secreted trypsin-like serine protease [Streptomyces sp. V4I23]|uniref:S1 family peptidase n=1 Tax=Streptomyces sp. V4I23 TaxID=3042282 RepID=UPI002783A4F6|nr:serine protease [Streptomyces sp. V4I23]MDQ1007756.1 secreted trypsin-like serine protease [Streptomyces sp. V4I23]